MFDTRKNCSLHLSSPGF